MPQFVPSSRKSPYNSAGDPLRVGATLIGGLSSSVNIALPRTTTRRPVRGQNTDSILLSAIAVSIFIHAVVLLIHFSSPDTFRFRSTEQLDIILVNAKGARPDKARAVAQTDLAGGGTHDKGRATSFLPRADTASDGDTPDPLQGEIAALEAKQKQLMAQAQQTNYTVETSNSQSDETADAPEVANRGIPHSEMARLEAEISKEISDYNARPRRTVIGPNTRQASYATYYRNWVDTVERYGNANYPDEARGKLYGDVVVSVTLGSDGKIYNNEIKVVQSSGIPVLDRAARRAAALAGPYPPFSSAMKKEFVVYELIIKFSYTRGDRLETQYSTG